LGIYVHYYQKSFPNAEIERKIKKSSKQVIVFYVADGKVSFINKTKSLEEKIT